MDSEDGEENGFKRQYSVRFKDFLNVQDAEKFTMVLIFFLFVSNSILIKKIDQFSDCLFLNHSMNSWFVLSLKTQKNSF